MTAEPAEAGHKVEDAVAFLVRSTSARPQTEAEVAGKLRARAFDHETVEAALARGRALGLVDDAAFARAWVDERGLQRGYGAARLRQELVRRRVPEHLVASALARLDDRDDEAAAEELARQRFARMAATVEPERAARRLAQLLARRGHPPGLAQRVALRVSGLDRQWD